MNPYEVLGVDKDATAAQIKKAYRRASRDAHPDRGGSNKQMADINVAYDLLCNPERRRAYDETGEDSQKRGPVGIDGEGRDNLMKLLLAALETPDEVDVIALISNALDQQRAQIALARAKLTQAKGKYERKLKRLKGPPDNFLSHMLQAQIDGIADKLKACDHDDEVVDWCGDTLADFSWDTTREPDTYRIAPPMTSAEFLEILGRGGNV